MNCLVSNGIVEQYGQLTDIKGSYSAQFEHVSSGRDSVRLNRIAANLYLDDLAA